MSQKPLHCGLSQVAEKTCNLGKTGIALHSLHPGGRPIAADFAAIRKLMYVNRYINDEHHTYELLDSLGSAIGVC